MLKQEFLDMIASMADPRFANLPEVLAGTQPEVSVRLNPRKPLTVSDFASDVAVAWWNGGRYLDERPKFTFDPALHQGAYYVQDASSMIIAAIARKLGGEIGKPLLWLDACAAPGGKTTAAIDALPEGSMVVANEYDFQRAEILKENVAKWGYPNVAVSRGDTAKFRKLRNMFDVVAVDAPCSGEGMMRKDATARDQWTPRLIAECADRQREILSNLWDSLRPGGYLVYSTCTFNTAENEEIVNWLIENFDATPLDMGFHSDGIDGAVNMEESHLQPTDVMRFIPGRIKGEGLFACVLQKSGILTPAIEDVASPSSSKKKGKQQKIGKEADDKVFANYFTGCKDTANGESGYAILKDEDTRYAFPTLWLPVLKELDKQLSLIAKGVEIGEMKGRDFVPSQSLALSTILNRGSFPNIEVGRAEALRYLSREAIILPDGTPKGFILLTHNDLPLGFVKNIGNRSNNLYPKEWRIKSKLDL